MKINTIIIHTPQKQLWKSLKSGLLPFITVRIYICQIIRHRIQAPLLRPHAAYGGIPSTNHALNIGIQKKKSTD
jgi:hypothetical protein